MLNASHTNRLYHKSVKTKYIYLIVHKFPSGRLFEMANILKRSTGLTGLAVANNPHYTLGALYGKILRTLAKMPTSSVYRTETEKIVKSRAEVLKKHQNPLDIEKAIGCGQAEELIVQAENELFLARKMLLWKCWEPLCVEPPKGQWDWPPVKP